jgi:TolB protein
MLVVGTDAASQIYAMRPDGSESRQLTRNNVMNTHPDWSPDGRQIVFVSMLDTTPATQRRPEIYVMDANGFGMHRLLRSETAWQPRWSPDGKQIIFQNLDRSVGRFRPYVMNSDGSDARLLVDAPGESFDLQWSPDGTRILFTSNRSPRNWRTMYIMNADGTGERQVAGDNACTTNASAGRWSPDGSRIAFGCDGQGVAGSGIFTIRPDGTDIQRVTTPLFQSADGGPVWSPDGSQLAFTSTADSDFSRYRWQVYVVSVSGGAPSRITERDSNRVVMSWRIVQ